MKIWLDAQISPDIAQWFRATYGVEALPVKDLGLRDATDRNIFLAAREVRAVVLTKDRDWSISLSTSVRRRRSYGSLAGTHRMQS